MIVDLLRNDLVACASRFCVGVELMVIERDAHVFVMISYVVGVSTWGAHRWNRARVLLGRVDDCVPKLCTMEIIDDIERGARVYRCDRRFGVHGVVDLSIVTVRS